MKQLIITACTLLCAITFAQAQDNNANVESEEKKETINIKIKDGAQPDIYVDGKKYDFPMDLIDRDRIESVKVIKGEEAIEQYNAENGVVLITTKEKSENIQLRSKKDQSHDKKTPLIIIDGEISNKKALRKLSSKEIQSVEIVKGEQAIETYNAPNGVVIVTTK